MYRERPKVISSTCLIKSYRTPGLITNSGADGGAPAL